MTALTLSVAERADICEALIRRAFDRGIDGAGYWEADVRDALGWDEYPAELPPPSPTVLAVLISGLM